MMELRLDSLVAGKLEEIYPTGTCSLHILDLEIVIV
jgi:hypothetical protein